MPLPTWTREHYPNFFCMPPYKLPLGTTIITYPPIKSKINQLKSATSSQPPPNNEKNDEKLELALKLSMEDV